MAENSEPEGESVDLLGDPWRDPRELRGRPRARRNRQVAETVSVLRAAGHTQEEIAKRVLVSEPVLRRLYFRELSDGPNLAKAMLREKLWAMAMGGNVAAAKAMLGEFRDGQGAVPVRPARQRAAPREEALGKKAQAEADAQTAHEGTEWGDLLH